MDISKDRIEQFLTHFGKDLAEDVIECDSGDLSIICNLDTEWQEFIGMSIFGVVRY